MTADQNSPQRPVALIVLFTCIVAGISFGPTVHMAKPVELMPLWAHTIIELWSIVIAFMAFSVVWNAEIAERPGRIVIIACGFLATGLIDVAHMLSYRGMPDFVTASSPQKAIDFWLSARAVQAASLFLATIWKWPAFKGPRARVRLLVSALALVAFVYSITLFAPEIWPVFFAEGTGLTLSKIAAEYAIVALLVPPAIVLYREARGSGSREDIDLCAACAISILSEICFTLYASVTDIYNLVGHLYKVVAFFFFYRAIFANCVVAPFERVKKEIAARESANRELQASERLLVEIGSNIPELLTVRDAASYDLLYASPSWERILGRTPGKGPPEWSPMDSVHVEDRARVSEELARHPSGGFDGVVRLVDACGTVRLVHLRTFPVRDAANEVYRIVAIGSDITERRSMERALEESESRLRAAVHITRLGIFDHDHDRDSLYVSPEGRTIFAWPSDEPACLERFFEGVHPDDKADVVDAIRRSFDPKGEGRYALEYRFVQAGGAIKWIEAWGQTTFHPDGSEVKLSRTVGAFMDVTQRHELADALQSLNRTLESRVAERTAELEKANAELEAFTYSVSHDLRAPLRHVVGYIDLLQRALPAGAGGDVERFSKIISDAARHMGMLIDSLLGFSRIGRTPMHLANVDMGMLVTDVRAELSHGLDRAIEWSVGALPVVLADATLLKVVWTNLVSNAIKFTAGRPDARIEIGCTRGASGDAPHVFYVKDNGAGFDMRYSDKLFGVFQRLHRREEFEGTGIGLASCKRIVERHGGRIWASAAPAGGATFSFTLASTSKAVA